jgi:nicotinamide riboside transporter PnuC
MIELLTSLGRTMGFSFAAGINLYATVAILGLAERYGWVALPEQFRVFDNDVVIAVALVLYCVEFVADKVPWLDSLWDAIHTLIRPVGGALIAVASLGHASPTVTGLVALLGGSLAAGTHLTKAGTRAVANTSPEPFSNWILSLAEDVFVVGLAALAMKYPLLAAVVVAVGVVLMLMFATWIARAIRRRWQRPSPRVPQESAVRT